SAGQPGRAARSAIRARPRRPSAARARAARAGTRGGWRQAGPSASRRPRGHRPSCLSVVAPQEMRSQPADENEARRARDRPGCPLGGRPQVLGVSAHDAVRALPPVRPGVTAVLDPLFHPAALAWRAFQQHACDTGHPAQARLALEQEDGSVSRRATYLLPGSDPDTAAANFRMLERLVKLALWARGGFRIWLD